MAKQTNLAVRLFPGNFSRKVWISKGQQYVGVVPCCKRIVDKGTSVMALELPNPKFPSGWIGYILGNSISIDLSWSWRNSLNQVGSGCPGVVAILSVIE